MALDYPAEWSSRLVCVLEGSGDTIFTVGDYTVKLAMDDLFDHTIEGVTTSYKVEGALLHFGSEVVQDLSGTADFTMITQRVTVSVVIPVP